MALLEDDNCPQLVVGGDGPLRAQYARTARERGLAEHVTFTGYIPDDALPAAYAAADVFTLPSTNPDQEGFGLVALEALACETPVVTTDIVGIAADIQRTAVGRVVEPGDPRALADAIRATLEESPDVGPGRRLCVESYSWTSSVEDLLAVYRRVLGAAE
jgi:glycosyltransferase involved in cell wall biosynthesis